MSRCTRRRHTFRGRLPRRGGRRGLAGPTAHRTRRGWAMPTREADEAVAAVAPQAEEAAASGAEPPWHRSCCVAALQTLNRAR